MESTTTGRVRLDTGRVRLNQPTPGKRRKANANRGNLTEDKVAALAPRRKPYRVWDTGSNAVKGLHVLVSPAGTKLYRYSFRFNRAPQATAYALGRWPSVTLEEARTLAAAAAKLVRKGIDPRASDPANSDSFKDVVATWHREEQVGRLKCKTADENRDMLLREFASLANRPIGTITYREVSQVLAAIRDKRKRVAVALRCHTYMKGMFAWAEREQLIARSPIAVMPPPAKPLPRRTRAWFAGEPADTFARSLWVYADTRQAPTQKLLKLMLCTGKRLGVIVGMRWEAIDKDWHWTPPPGAKNKRNNPITLPKLAREIIGPRQSAGLVLGYQFTRGDLAMLARQVRKHVEPTYLHHGCRHLVATKLKELRVDFEVRRLVLDHNPITDTHSGYEHDDAKEEMAEALEQWCKRLEAVVTGKLPLKRERL